MAPTEVAIVVVGTVEGIATAEAIVIAEVTAIVTAVITVDGEGITMEAGVATTTVVGEGITDGVDTVVIMAMEGMVATAVMTATVGMEDMAGTEAMEVTAGMAGMAVTVMDRVGMAMDMEVSPTNN